MKKYYIIFSILFLNRLAIAQSSLWALEYDALAYPESNSGIIIAKKNKREGIVDKNGNIIIPLKYTKIFQIPTIDDKFETTDSLGKVGVINKNNDVIIPFIYDRIVSYNKDWIAVEQNGKFGFIDNNNQVIIPLIYEAAYIDNNVGIIRKDSKYSLINRKNQILTDFKYSSIYNFREGLAVAKIGEKYGYINELGQEVIPFKYDFAHSFEEDKAIVLEDNGLNCIDKTGRTILSNISVSDCTDFHFGTASVFRMINNKHEWCLLTQEGNVISTNGNFCFYENFGLWNVENNIKSCNQHREGLMNSKGDIIVEMEYNEIGYDQQFNPFIFYGIKKDSLLLIDTLGHIIKKFQIEPGLDLDFLKPIFPLRVKNNEKWAYIDKNGMLLCHYDYDNVSDFKGSHYAKVMKKDKIGWIDRNGKIVIPIEYDAFHIYQDFIVHGKNGLFGALDFKLKEVLPLQYESSVDVMMAIDEKTK
jgi:hypothetical protein